MLKTDDDVVGKSHDDHLTRGLTPSPAFSPEIEHMASHAEEFHLRVLLEPDVTLARHPAPDVQPT